MKSLKYFFTIIIFSNLFALPSYIDIETIYSTFSFKDLTEEEKRLAIVPSSEGMHVGVYRFYWDVPSMQYFSNQVKNDQNVLEIGCATGQLTFQLCKEKPKSKIVAIDFNSVAINYALAEQREHIIDECHHFKNITFLTSDFGQQFFFERDYNFDHISFFNVAHFLTPQQLNTSFCNIRNCLAQKGFLYFSTVAMIQSVKNDELFMKKYRDAIKKNNIQYPGYVYGTSSDLSNEQNSFKYSFAEKLTGIPLPFQNIENKKTLFLGDAHTIQRMMINNGIQPVFTFYSSARLKKHYIHLAEALIDTGDFTLHIIAKLDE